MSNNINRLFAVVDDNMNVTTSVTQDKYYENPLLYKLFAIRIIAVTEDKRIVLSSSNRCFADRQYDTPYCRFIEYKEDYENAFDKLSFRFHETPRYIMQHHYSDYKYDIISRLYYVRIKESEFNKLKYEDIETYSIEEALEKLPLRGIAAEELTFFKENIYPFLDLDVRRY